MVSERRAFGDRLRRQRERAGVSLEAIARSSKVPESLFAGLERGDCSKWPAGIYGRAYVKAYAEAIGLPGADTVEEFSEVFGVTHEQHTATAGRAPRRSLRLSMAEEPGLLPEIVAHRAALAAADLLLGLLIASTALVGLHAGVWTTIGSVLAYFVVGRLLSDHPLLYWAFLRLRAPRIEARAEPQDESVAVADTASTTA